MIGQSSGFVVVCFRCTVAGLLAGICLPVELAQGQAASRPQRDAGQTRRASDVLKMLASGNARFAHETATHPHLDSSRRHETEKDQHPIATILACSDSRVPVEEIFDEGVGDLFVVRVAGNVCGADEIGSIEYGAVHLRTPAVIVLGHTSCGAVTAVVEGEIMHGSVPALVAKIKPAVTAVQRAHPELHGKALVPHAVRANVFHSIVRLLRQSPELRELVARGELAVVGAVYHLDTGMVEWLGPHPRQRGLVAHPPEPHSAASVPHDRGRSPASDSTVPAHAE
jgi:carbonic anhydrase